MGRPGSALDNAVIESLALHRGVRAAPLEHFATKAQARGRVAAWIEEYNHDRRHSALGMRSPIAYELALRSRATSRSRRHERTGSRAPSMTPSSPASRPSPSGGLRPALTPAPGDGPKQRAGAGRNTRSTNQVSTVSGDCRGSTSPGQASGRRRRTAIRCLDELDHRSRGSLRLAGSRDDGWCGLDRLDHRGLGVVSTGSTTEGWRGLDGLDHRGLAWSRRARPPRAAWSRQARPPRAGVVSTGSTTEERLVDGSTNRIDHHSDGGVPADAAVAQRRDGCQTDRHGRRRHLRSLVGPARRDGVEPQRPAHVDDRAPAAPRRRGGRARACGTGSPTPTSRWC